MQAMRSIPVMFEAGSGCKHPVRKHFKGGNGFGVNLHEKVRYGFPTIIISLSYYGVDHTTFHIESIEDGVG